MNERDLERINNLAEGERRVKEIRSNLKRRQLPSVVIRMYVLTACYCIFSSMVCFMLMILQSQRNKNITGGLDSIFRFNDRQSSIPRHAVNTKKAKLAVEGFVANQKKDFKAIIDRVVRSKQYIDLNEEFKTNDDLCEKSLLDIKSSFPEVHRNFSTYTSKSNDVVIEHSLYQLDAIAWLILSSEELFNLKNWTNYSQTEKQQFADSYYFISENFWKSFLFDFDQDRVFIPALYESLVKKHAVWTIGSFCFQILVFLIIGALLVLNTVKLFSKIKVSFSIFGRLPHALVQSISSRAALFKIQFLDREVPEHANKYIEEYYMEKDSWEEGWSPRKRDEAPLDSEKLLPELQDIVQEAISEEGMTPQQFFKANRFSSSSRIFFGQTPRVHTTETAALIPTITSSFKITGTGDNIKLRKKGNKILFGSTAGSRTAVPAQQPPEQPELEAVRVEQIEQPTKMRYMSTMKRLGCSGMLMFPTQIAIVLMDYNIYQEYRAEAQLVNANMEIRTSLHYLNSLNFEMITSAQVPFGKTAESRGLQTNLIDHFLKTTDDIAAYYMGLDVARFPKYVRPVMERFDRYSQGNVCSLGGITFISYLTSRRPA